MSEKEKKLGSFLDSVQHISIPHQERKNQPLLMLLCNVLAISLESTLSQFSPRIKIGQNPQKYASQAKFIKPMTPLKLHIKEYYIICQKGDAKKGLYNTTTLCIPLK